ncbi:MAG: hypothetical protein ACTSO2_19570 [Promethearchaeota archaeon]
MKKSYIITGLCLGIILMTILLFYMNSQYYDPYATKKIWIKGIVIEKHATPNNLSVDLWLRDVKKEGVYIKTCSNKHIFFIHNDWGIKGTESSKKAYWLYNDVEEGDKVRVLAVVYKNDLVSKKTIKAVQMIRFEVKREKKWTIITCQ